MTGLPQRLHDLLAMSRFANLPTVWSNAFLGLVMGGFLFKIDPSAQPPLFYIAIFVSLSCLYLGGCFLNDWHDASFDAKHKPDRAIPSGRWKRATIGRLAASLMGFGLLIAFLTQLTFGIFLLGIVLCIYAYTYWHKVHPISFIFMAGARALIYPACCFSWLTWGEFSQCKPAHFPILIVLSLCLGAYILGISLLARTEASPEPPTPQQQFFPLICLLTPCLFISGFLLLITPPALVLPSLVLFLAVLIFSVRRLRSTKDVGKFVSRALAAIPLVDGLLLGPLALQGSHAYVFIIPPLLAFLAYILQKIAPAT